MCGIAGIIPGAGAPPMASVVAALGNALAHRGPDDVGYVAWRRGTPASPSRTLPEGGETADVWLAHRRLSILDPSPARWQPMVAADGRYAIVYNGEIYNFIELRTELAVAGDRFVSNCDTEVLLRAYVRWGEAVLSRLVGMFAFAILDTAANEMFLARDPFGIKPLYYAALPGEGLAFASEVRPLLDIPGVSRRIAPAELYRYLRFGRCDDSAQTLFADIKSLPPAHSLRIDLSRPSAASPRRYWDVPPPSPETISPADAAARLRETFVDSVRLHLRSDVPVAVALSGGIDSSAIAFAAREHFAGDLHAFSYIAAEPAPSEERWIDTAVDGASLIAHKVTVDGSEFADDLAGLVGQQDMPFAGTSIYAQARVHRAAAAAGFKVILDGQGADELFGGYPVFQAARFADLVRSGRLAAARLLWHIGATAPGDARTRDLMRVGAYLSPPGLRGSARWAAGEELVPRWLNGDWFRAQGVAAADPGATYGRDAFRTLLTQTLTHTSLPALLRHVDRNSMAVSLESRVPFLTTRLVEAAAAMPDEYLIGRNGTTKAVLRKALRGLVPDSILDRQDKVGFVTPESVWLKENAVFFDDIFGSDRLDAIPAFDSVAVRRLWSAFRSGKSPSATPAWRWANLVMWAEQVGAEFPA